jgi:hypothetical protein
MPQPADKRIFPRISAECPVLYLGPGMQRWLVGKLIDFSATGLRLTCDTLLETGDEISIQIKPGSNRKIPAISGVGSVVRTDFNNMGQYEISIKMLRVNKPA